jgi:DNA excision repair protein ERCC-2
MSEGLTNLSTDMAIAVAKKFMRAMGQPFEQSQLGVSLWDSAMVNEVSRKESLSMAAKIDGMMEIDAVDDMVLN